MDLQKSLVESLKENWNDEVSEVFTVFATLVATRKNKHITIQVIDTGEGFLASRQARFHCDVYSDDGKRTVTNGYPSPEGALGAIAWEKLDR